MWLCGRNFWKCGGIHWKDMPWRACGGPDHVEIEQSGIQPGADRVQMTDGGHATDGKAGLCPDQGRVGLAQWRARTGRRLVGVHAVAARGQEQHRIAAVLGTEDDGFDDLVEVAADAVGGVLGGAGLSDVADVDGQSGGLKGGADTFEAFAHGGTFAENGCWARLKATV